MKGKILLFSILLALGISSCKVDKKLDVRPKDSEVRKWIEKQAANIDEKMKAYDSAEVDVFAFTDIFLVSKSLWENMVKKWVCKKPL